MGGKLKSAMHCATPPLRCVIVEDHRMFAELVATMLRMSKNLPIQIVATVGTVAEGIAACEKYEPELLILDLALPDGRGLCLAQSLATINPNAKVIVLSGQASSFVCPAVLNGRIEAVVDKTKAFDALQTALHKFVSARRPSDQKAAMAATRPRVAGRLTLREQEILFLVGQGLRSKEIAERLRISAHTVQAHRRTIAEKLGTTGAELSRQAFHFHQQLAVEMVPGE
jgi:DNA-binding NarL/FixJ family response regulator